MTTTTIDRYTIEKQQGWRDEIAQIPWIKFPADWDVKIIPPFGDAVVRFQIRLPSGATKSIYLDSRDSLGYVGEPYWEVYPYQNDTGRCLIGEVDKLLQLIADESASDSEEG
jgi:hypothetical protein